MSLMDAKQYFRDCLTGLGYKEHLDAFNFENIPGTLFDKAFHVELINAAGFPHDNQCIKIEPSFLCRIFLKGFRNPAAKLDEALVRAQAIIEEALRASKRLGEPTVHNVHFNTLDIRPLETNDNAIIIELGFRCQVYSETNT
jgi:hypothetical protein